MLDLTPFLNDIKLIHTKEQLNQFSKIYVTNYKKIDDFNELINLFPVIPHKIIRYEFQKQYDNQLGIQGGVLVELTILATIAKIFNIDNFSYTNNKYIYENEDYSFTLQGNSGHGGITSDGNDIIIFDKKNHINYNCEVKEPFARLSEKDFIYDEEGHLCKGTRTSYESIIPYLGIINSYNNHTCVFDHIGHNFSLTEDMVAEIIEFYFQNIDYLLTFQDEYLLIIPKNKNLFKLIYDSNGSEIRGVNGKNLKNIFTPKYARSVLDKFLIKEDNQYYYFPKNIFEVRQSRQSDGVRYVLKEGFAIKGSNAIIEEDVLKCLKNNLKQNSPLVSPKMKLIANYQDIKNIILKGEY